MISFHASAVCRVRDGYTGRPLLPAALLCTLDGAPCRPVGKQDGYLILVNLTPGRHRLSLTSRGYQEEWVEFDADSGTRELDITMKPGPGYPFRQTITRLRLTVLEKKAPAAGRQLWLACTGRPELKIAQSRAEAGDSQLRLYCKGPEVPALPGVYLIADGKDSEIVGLRTLREELGTLAAPLCRDHTRSRLLLPVQRYHTDEAGILTAVFREPCSVEVYDETAGLLGSLTLAEGENDLEVSL